jgi:hypothetical protein
MASAKAKGRLAAALSAGAVAIVVNTLALKAADFVPLATARGGLLRLIRPWFAPVLKSTGVSHAWSAAGGPAPATPLFQTGFHLAVGMLMALVYAYLLEPRLNGGPWRKGVVYAAAVWLLNAAVVLPLTGEGFAGSAHLTTAGMVWFAAAHTLFFVLLAVLYAAWLKRPKRVRR